MGNCEAWGCASTTTNILHSGRNCKEAKFTVGEVSCIRVTHVTSTDVGSKVIWGVRVNDLWFKCLKKGSLYTLMYFHGTCTRCPGHNDPRVWNKEGPCFKYPQKWGLELNFPFIRDRVPRTHKDLSKYSAFCTTFVVLLQYLCKKTSQFRYWATLWLHALI